MKHPLSFESLPEYSSGSIQGCFPLVLHTFWSPICHMSFSRFFIQSPQGVENHRYNDHFSHRPQLSQSYAVISMHYLFSLSQTLFSFEQVLYIIYYTLFSFSIKAYRLRYIISYYYHEFLGHLCEFLLKRFISPPCFYDQCFFLFVQNCEYIIWFIFFPNFTSVFHHNVKHIGCVTLMVPNSVACLFCVIRYCADSYCMVLDVVHYTIWYRIYC